MPGESLSTPRKILVAMSGGVDSSVAAALLKDQGHEVVGVFMRLGSPGETIDELQPFDSAGVSCDPAKVKIGHQGCCSINDAADARLVAAHLGIPLYVCNFKKDFGRIIDYFVDEYANGRTPNPCVRCNDWLKFGKLHDYAAQIGADAVASGHYARVDHTANQLHRGVDHGKDQSYVLFGIARDRLSEMILPIGSYTKPEIRAIAEEKGLPVFDKPDSQEICFVPDNDYAGLVERRRPDLAAGARGTGEIRDTQGNVLGEHEGQHKFTVGQRRGIGVALGHPIYVVERNPQQNTVTVGDREDLEAVGLIAREANWLIDEADIPYADSQPDSRADSPDTAAPEGRAVSVQYRYNSAALPARIRRLPQTNDDTPSGRPGRFEVIFDQPVEAVAPGQAAVVYDAANPDLVLGGGWIERALRSPRSQPTPQPTS